MATSGKETTEYKQVQNSNLFNDIFAACGVIIAVGSSLGGLIGPTSQVGVAAGILVTIASVISKTLVQTGYIKGRSEVKSAEAKSK